MLMIGRYYPETVSYKYFVNVPMIMQWMMAVRSMHMRQNLHVTNNIIRL